MRGKHTRGSPYELLDMITLNVFGATVNETYPPDNNSHLRKIPFVDLQSWDGSISYGKFTNEVEQGNLVKPQVVVNFYYKSMKRKVKLDMAVKGNRRIIIHWNQKRQTFITYCKSFNYCIFTKYESYYSIPDCFYFYTEPYFLCSVYIGDLLVFIQYILIYYKEFVDNSTEMT